MPPKKRKATKAPLRGRRQPAITRRNEHPADYYNEMLDEEAAVVATSSGDDGRAIKKRRTTGRSVVADQKLATPAKRSLSPARTPESTNRPQQIVYDDEQTEGSDFEFEDVDLDGVPQERDDSSEQPTAADLATDLNITVTLDSDKAKGKKSRTNQRLSSSTIEKQKRIDIHKVHLCCLLAHVYMRNAWCNDEQIQQNLASLIGDRTRAYLHPPSSESQFQRSRSLQDGLQQASDTFRIAFKIVARGLRRPHWNISGDQLAPLKNTETAIDKKAFIKLAKKRQGSRDVGAQLFCALLRGLDVDARLVCSLQPLSFASAPPTQSPQKQKQTVRMTASDTESGPSGNESTGSNTSSIIGNGVTPKIPPPIKRFGASAVPAAIGNADLGQAPSPVKRKRIIESKYPVYWVEVFDAAYQKWLAVDPLVTRTVDKPQKLEPPLADSSNDMIYVVAFDESGSAKDVTRRYAKAYNAKTRRSRVEATKDGQRWWKRAMKIYKGPKQDRDQVEDAELSRKEAAEPMPRNVQDFKDHPYYAIERHLKHNEVIHPKREVGKLTTGKGAPEPIYRRSDVQLVRSADKWYRSGRELKPGEQPLKYGTARRAARRGRSASPNDSANEGDEQGLALYTIDQTNIYIPAPVTKSRISKNAFGNLDIYVPSMIPPGAIHIHALEASKAAKVLGIDYADAVTGFKFQGRRGTAIVDGVVVASEFEEAMKETILSLRWQLEREEQEKRGKEAIKWWKKFLVGLRVRERIMGYEVEGEKKSDAEKDKEIYEKMEEIEEEEERGHYVVEQGGFLPDVDQGPSAQPTAGNQDEPDMFGGGDVGINDYDSLVAAPRIDNKLIITPSPWDKGGALYHLNPHKVSPQRKKPQLPRTHTPGLFLSPTRPDDEIEEGGGFFADHDNEGGGFVPEDDGNEDVMEGGGFLTNAGEDVKLQNKPPPGIRTYDSLFEDPNEANGAEQVSAQKDADGIEQEGGGGFTIDEDVARMEVEGDDSVGGGDGGFIIEDNTAVEPNIDTQLSGVVEPSEALKEAATTGDGHANPNPKVKAKDAGTEEDEMEADSDLLSHDEDDEDAEPEWLVDEIGW